MANSIESGALVAKRITDAAITVLSEKLVPLNLFTTAFSTDAIAPRATIAVPIVSGGTSNVLTNGTNFEVGSHVLSQSAVTVNQYTVTWHMNNNEIQNGYSVDLLTKRAATQFANQMIDNVTTVIAAANFSAATGNPKAAAAFTGSIMNTLWEDSKNFSSRNLVLDATYLKNFIPTSLQSFNFKNLGVGVYGFDNVVEMNRWDGAGVSNLKGFVCGPEAIAIATGVPIRPKVDASVTVTPIFIESIGLTAHLYNWYSLSSRSEYFSLDIMFGAAKGDGNALKYICTA